MTAKILIGIILIVVGIASGLYVGLWVCFIGGICDVINQIRAENMVAMSVALGIAKVMFAGLAGWLSAVICLIPGFALIND